MSSCLIIDHGLFTSFAERLAEDHDVKYFVPFADRSFPKHGPAMLGEGLKNVERVNNWETYIDSVDFVVFPDVGFMFLAEWLRSHGYKVWGAGLGEKLEVQRWRAKETMRELGLPVGKCQLVTGMTALREYIRNNEGTYIKISGFRGVAETFPADTYDLVAPRLAELELELGGASEVFPFVIEHKVDSVVEAGYDGYCINGEFPETCLTGVEVKDKGYLGAVRDYKKLSEPVKIVNEKLAPFMKEAGYCQFFSTEIRVTEDGVPYLIDLTTRCPAPPSALYWEMIENVGEIVEAGANGFLVEPVWRAKYGALAIIHSSFAEERWCPVSVDPKVRQWVKWRNYAEIEGQGYIIPTEGVRMCEIGDVIGIGDTIEEAIEACQEHAEGVKGFGLHVNTDAVIEALNEIHNAEENDIIFSDDEMPTQKDLL
jgi:hypothetical protein